MLNRGRFAWREIAETGKPVPHIKPPAITAGGVNEPQEEPARWGVSPNVNCAAEVGNYKVWNTRLTG